MALINNLYVFVENESLTHDVETTSHPVERGIDITDHVQRQPVVLSISGKIVDVGDVKSHNILSNLKHLENNGTLIDYIGRNIQNNLQIQEFETDHPNATWGGCDFTMTLKEVEIAANSYTGASTEKGVINVGSQQIQEQGTNEKIYHTVKKGDTVYKLANVVYKNYGNSCQWIMNNNPRNFSVAGDYATLIVGSKLWVGTRV